MFLIGHCYQTSFGGEIYQILAFVRHASGNNEIRALIVDSPNPRRIGSETNLREAGCIRWLTLAGTAEDFGTPCEDCRQLCQQKCKKSK